MEEDLRRMKALIAQAVAEAHHEHKNPRIIEVALIAYGDIPAERLTELFTEASRGTLAEGALVRVQETGTRYICWNCCGLRFESVDGVCPNCGEMSLEVPEAITFSLRDSKVEERDEKI